jgi:hypothetical protein
VNGDIELLLEKATQSLDAADLLRQKGYFDFAASRARPADPRDDRQRIAWNLDGDIF